MVGLGRLELPTSRLSGVRSNRAELQALMQSVRSPNENESSCLKKEKRRRRRPACIKDPAYSFDRLLCLGRADRNNVSVDPEGSSLERR
jgi:hypothetical protein